MNLKPFVLADALRGEPVVTRDGRKVTQLTRFECDSLWTLMGVVNGRRLAWLDNGQETKGATNSNDLMMLPNTRVVWLNFYPTQLNVSGTYAVTFSSQENADAFRNDANRIGGRAVRVEIEV